MGYKHGASLRDRAAGLRPQPSVFAEQHHLRVAERLLRERDRRSRYLPSQFTDGAAWGILLDLYRREPQRISSICYGTGEAFTTALRAVHDLEGAGHIKREAVAGDRRGSTMRLSDWAKDQLTDYLAEIIA